MWFETTEKPNKDIMKDLHFIPIKVLEMWECKKCMNIIFSKKYTFSPLVKETDLLSDSWSLENIIVKIEPIKLPKSLKSNFQKEEFFRMNGVKVYCRVCDEKLLGEFKPLIDVDREHFKYEFVVCDENVKKTKIIMGRSNIKEMSKTNSKILKESNSTDSLTVLKEVCSKINQYVAIWYYSKNLRVYRPFVEESRKSRQYLMSMKGFIMKTTKARINSERESLRFKLRQNSCSHNSASMTI